MAMPQDFLERVTHPGTSGDVSLSFDLEGLTVVELGGEIDLALAASLDFVADQAIERGCAVRVDVSRVTFIDSTGLGLIARLAAAGAAAGWKPVVVGASTRVWDSIVLGGLLPLLDLTDSR